LRETVGVGDELDPREVEALYSQTPDGFISARNELVARLRQEGVVEAAKEAAALRKPTVAAWAVDRLARDDANDVSTLLEAGKELVAAQRRATTPRGANRLLEASAERRRLVDRLVKKAGRALQKAGMSAARPTLDKVANTLMAIATDEEAADLVRRGVLDKELPRPPASVTSSSTRP